MKKGIKIGYNEAEAFQHQTESNLKLEILGAAVSEFRTLFNSDIDDLEQFEKGFCEYALIFAKNKHKSGLLLELKDDQFINLYGYSFDKLQILQAKYNTQKGFLTYKNGLFGIDNTLDFNAYATTDEQIQKYNDIMQLIAVVEKLHANHYKEDIAITQIPLNRLFVLENDSLIPNRYAIQ